jgi:hypothetical protein
MMNSMMANTIMAIDHASFGTFMGEWIGVVIGTGEP